MPLWTGHSRQSHCSGTVTCNAFNTNKHFMFEYTRVYSIYFTANKLHAVPTVIEEHVVNNLRPAEIYLPET